MRRAAHYRERPQKIIDFLIEPAGHLWTDLTPGRQTIPCYPPPQCGFGDAEAPSNFGGAENSAHLTESLLAA
jgi:hypothetical protein